MSGAPGGRTYVLGGLTEKETGDELGVSDRTVKREWRYARLWLRRELSQGRSID